MGSIKPSTMATAKKAQQTKNINRGQLTRDKTPVDPLEALQKNKNSFLNFMQDAQEKKQISKMNKYINQLESQISHFDLNEELLNTIETEEGS